MPAEIVKEDTLEDLISPLKMYSDSKNGRYQHKRLASDDMLEKTFQKKLHSPKMIEDKKFKNLKLKPTQNMTN